MAYQNLFEALQNICSFTALESEMFEIIDAYEKDKAKQLSQADVSGRSEQVNCIHKTSRLRIIGRNLTCLDCKTTWRQLT